MVEKKEFFDASTSICIDGTNYYSITLAFQTFRIKLKNGIGFSAFYKNFAHWRCKNNIQAESRHIAKLYSEKDICSYINYLNSKVEIKSDGVQ